MSKKAYAKRRARIRAERVYPIPSDGPRRKVKIGSMATIGLNGAISLRYRPASLQAQIKWRMCGSSALSDAVDFDQKSIAVIVHLHRAGCNGGLGQDKPLRGTPRSSRRRNPSPYSGPTPKLIPEA